jgi:cardiolipin synthase
VTGSVVAQIEEVFIRDWEFATGEELESSPGSSDDNTGDAMCRAIVDGPNEDIDKLAMILIGAVSAAQHSVFIMTPYFLPSRELVSALQAAALRGVDVCVILPGKNNQPLAHWATRNMLWELLHWGVKVYYQPPPFVHSKLFVVDSHYVQVGTANIDPRSLRLNFELALEIYDKPFAAFISDHFDRVRAGSHALSLQEVDGRPLPARLRDAVAWLFSPYL